MRRGACQSGVGLLGLLLMGTSAFAQAAAPAALPELPPMAAPAAVPVTAPAPVPDTANVEAAPVQPSAATPDAAALPPVAGSAGNLPPLPGTSQANPGQQAAGPIPSSHFYSFGDSNVSVLFLPEQIEKMKKALIPYEDEVRRTGGKFGVTDVEAPVITEPPSYPVFYLSSIAYRAAGDWTVWISGHKITPKKNDTDVTVVSVAPGQATFTWKPAYGEFIQKRKEQNLFADVEKIKNRTVPSNFQFDEPAGVVTFTLKPNQSFAVGYFAMFEGYIDSPALQPLPQSQANGAAGAGAAGAPADATAGATGKPAAFGATPSQPVGVKPVQPGVLPGVSSRKPPTAMLPPINSQKP